MPSRYCRQRDLPKLVHLWPHETEDCTVAGHGRLLARLRKALREERKRGLAGNWTYDLARHTQLLEAYRTEIDLYLAKQRQAQKADAAGQAPVEAAIG